MEKKFIPRLCGGTLFTLILQARKPRATKKENQHGFSDGLSDSNVLGDLIRMFFSR